MTAGIAGEIEEPPRFTRTIPRDGTRDEPRFFGIGLVRVDEVLIGGVKPPVCVHVKLAQRMPELATMLEARVG
jgi:hypothetical protein